MPTSNSSSLRSTVLVAGSANLDFVVRCSHVPAAGETVLGRDFATFPGGKGANQAVACARATATPTQMLLALGADAHAEPLERSLRDAGVALHIVRIETMATGTALICVADSGENAITVAPGANDALHATHLPSLASISHLLLQLETPMVTVAAFAQAAHTAGICVVLNAAPARALPPELLSAVDVLIVNEGELAAISGVVGDIAQALKSLPLPCVIVTLGARGACAWTQGGFHLQPAFAIDAIDTTAAGDTFCGALTGALCQRQEMSEALQRASAASALACLRLGAQSSIPDAPQVEAFLREHPPFDDRSLRELAAYCKVPDASDP